MRSTILFQAGVSIVTTLILIVGGACAQTAAQPAARPDQPMTVASADQLKAAGKNATLTILPAQLGGKPSKPVGEVVGMLLERAGMNNLELGTAAFTPPATGDLADTAKALSDFVRADPPQTDYTLFADFLGSPQKGVAEVRGVIVNRAGDVVWQDRQTPADADFKRMKPKEPLECCVLLVERLRPVLQLDDPTRADAPAGKLAKRWQENTGLPSDAERAALKENQYVFKTDLPTAALLIYPARAAGEWSSESAVHLAKLIDDAKLAKVAAADQGPQLQVPGNMNEQKVLWDTARGVREYVQAHRPDADYVLYADYLMGKDASGADKVGGVHFVVCDRDGRLVIVDFQNDHQRDFQTINPTSRADCDRLVAKRLEAYCR